MITNDGKIKLGWLISKHVNGCNREQGSYVVCSLRKRMNSRVEKNVGKKQGVRRCQKKDTSEQTGAACVYLMDVLNVVFIDESSQ